MNNHDNVNFHIYLANWHVSATKKISIWIHVCTAIQKIFKEKQSWRAKPKPKINIHRVKEGTGWVGQEWKLNLTEHIYWF